MYPYHNVIKQRIRNGEFLGFVDVPRYKTVKKPRVVLLFKTAPFERPIKPEVFKEQYSDMVNAWILSHATKKAEQTQALEQPQAPGFAT